MRALTPVCRFVTAALLALASSSIRYISNNRIAIVEKLWSPKGSVKRGLILHFLFFKDEIRDFDAIAKGEDIKLPGEQLELGMNLIEKMSMQDELRRAVDTIPGLVWSALPAKPSGSSAPAGKAGASSVTAIGPSESSSDAAVGQ
jgi:non-homologous end joining protein Ku